VTAEELSRKHPDIANLLTILADAVKKSGDKGLSQSVSLYALSISSFLSSGKKADGPLAGFEVDIKSYISERMGYLKSKNAAEKKQIYEGLLSFLKVHANLVHELNINNANLSVGAGIRSLAAETQDAIDSLPAPKAAPAEKLDSSGDWRGSDAEPAVAAKMRKQFAKGQIEGMKHMVAVADKIPKCPKFTASSKLTSAIAHLVGAAGDLDIRHIQSTARSENLAMKDVMMAGRYAGQIISAMYMDHKIQSADDSEDKERISHAIGEASKSEVDFGKANLLWSEPNHFDKIISAAKAEYTKSSAVVSALNKKMKKTSLAPEEWGNVLDGFFESIKSLFLKSLNPGNGVIDDMFTHFPSADSPFYNALEWFDYKYQGFMKRPTRASRI